MANSKDIEETIKSYILAEYLPGEDPASLTDSTPLISAGILDSIATLKLVDFLETTFSISVAANETDAEHLDTIDRIAQLVRASGGSAKD
jgi:acyl carrier protein